jgi:hypothetical protein
MIRTGKFCFAALIFLLALVPISAYTVSCMVIETGIEAESPAVASSNVWESGLLDACFDSGHIVSNAPIKRLQVTPAKQFPDEAEKDFNEALAGMADYFVLILLDYTGKANQKRPQPEEVSLRVFKVNPRRFIAEQKITPKGNTSPEEEFINAKKAAGLIIRHFK